MSHGGYPSLPSLPDIDAVLRDVGRKYGTGGDRASPAPGSWGFSPVDSALYDSPAGSTAQGVGDYHAADNRSESRTVADPLIPPPPPDPLPELKLPDQSESRTVSKPRIPPPPPDPLPEVKLPDGRTAAPEGSKCDTCAQALAEADSLGTEAAIRCLWAAASRTPDGRGGTLIDGLDPDDPDRLGLIAEIRARCQATERRTAAAPKCDTCLQALAVADFLPPEEAIRCLWSAAFRTFDGRGRPLTDGLSPGDPNRSRLLSDLRARCQAAERRTAAEAPRCDTCLRALAVADFLPQEEAIRCLWAAASGTPDGRGGTLADGLDPDDPDRLGLIAELRARCQAAEKGRAASEPSFRLNRFPLAVQPCGSSPFLTDYFPCPPDERRLEADQAAHRWWYGPPDLQDRRAADWQVRDLQGQLERCADRVVQEAAEPQARFNDMAQAIKRLPAEIQDLKDSAVAWATESLRNMSTLSIMFVSRARSQMRWIPGRYEYLTLPSDAIESEYARRTDKPSGVLDNVVILPTHPGYKEALEEAKQFDDGQHEYDDALREITATRKALESAVKCAVLFMLPERALIADAALGLLGKSLHPSALPLAWDNEYLPIAPPVAPSGRGVLDSRFEARRQQLREAVTRYDLSESSCELMYRLCCALQECEMMSSALEAIRAVEKYRHFTSKFMKRLAGQTAGIVDPKCEDHIRDQGLEGIAETMVSGAVTNACSFAGGDRGSVDWDSIVRAVGDLIERNKEWRDTAGWLRDKVDAVVGRTEVFLLISDVAGYAALALAIIQGGWRLLIKKPPPRVPIGRRRPPPERPPPERVGGKTGVPAKEGTRSGGPAGKGEFSFSEVEWSGYPSGLRKPTGPFRLLEGSEYEAARAAANRANAALRAADPAKYAGKQIHEVHPVKFGGSPTDPANKVALTPTEHARYTTFWNRLMRERSQ